MQRLSANTYKRFGVFKQVARAQKLPTDIILSVQENTFFMLMVQSCDVGVFRL